MKIASTLQDLMNYAYLCSPSYLLIIFVKLGYIYAIIFFGYILWKWCCLIFNSFRVIVDILMPKLPQKLGMFEATPWKK